MALHPVRTKQEASARGRAGGVASGQARRLKRDARKTLELLLQGRCIVDGQKMTRLEAICLAQCIRAMGGDTQAFKAVLDRLEGRPVQAILTDEPEIEPLDVKITVVPSGLHVDPNDDNRFIPFEEWLKQTEHKEKPVKGALP